MRLLRGGPLPHQRHDLSPWTEHDVRCRLLDPTLSLPVAALLQVRGDWEWLSQCFRLRHPSAEHFCWLCNCCATGALSYFNVSPEAGHRGTLLTHEMYIEHCLRSRSQPSSVFASPGFRLEYLAIDSMHAADLGVFQDALGSLFWLEVTNRQWHRSRQAGISYLQGELRDYYRANPHLARLQLTLSQLKASSPRYPSLRAKAAQTRHLADFALALAQRHARGDATRGPFRFRPTSRLGPYSAEYREAVVRLFGGMAGYHRSCRQEPFNAALCKDGMYAVLQGMNTLRLLMRRHLPPEEHPDQPFPLRPKAHMLQHLVEDKILLWGPRADSGAMGTRTLWAWSRGSLEARETLGLWSLWSCRSGPFFPGCMRWVRRGLGFEGLGQ